MTDFTLWGDCLELIPKISSLPGGYTFDLVIADPPYDDVDLINNSIVACRRLCKGPSFFFMYAETVFDLLNKPDQILFWLKPPSTKSTKKRYSRFVEIIAAYDLDRSPFNQDTHWHTRSGVFMDTVASTAEHPYKKPDGLIEKLILVNSNPGDVVLDPFSGSGTVSEVCRRLGRGSISIEKDSAHQRKA